MHFWNDGFGERASLSRCLPDRKTDRCVGEPLVGLRLGPRLVVGIEIFDRAFAEKRARQDHHADEAGRTIVRGLRKDRIRSGLIPGAAGAVAGRDPNA